MRSEIQSRDSSAGLASVGRYVLFDEIASGGMATIHLGRLVGEGGFKRTVAVKRLHKHLLKDPEFVGMFIDEARVASRVQHANVVATLDVLRLEGELLQVMEYVHGASLSRLLRTVRKNDEQIPPKIVGAIATRMLYGLHAAHEATDDHGEPLNMIHRDVSPQNVLVGEDGVARVLDFGVAKAAIQAQSTKSGQVKGKLAYMPPEQLMAEGVSRRTDIYSAGVVVWEMVTGERMRKAKDEAQMFGKIIEGDLEAPSQRVPTVDTSLDAVIMKALARDPADRYATALEFADALEEVLGVAPPHTVSKWVKDHAAEVLLPLAEKVREMESGQISGVRATDLDEVTMTKLRAEGLAGEASFQEATFATTKKEVVSGGSGRVLIAVAALVLGAVGAWFWKSSSESKGAAATPTAAVTAGPAGTAKATASPTPEPEATAKPTPTATATAAPEPSASASAASKAAKPKPKPRARPKPRPVAKPKPVPAKPKANCNPPYYLTADGVRRYKVECL